MTSSTVGESRAEQAVWASTVLDNTPLMAAYWDKNQRCKFASSAYERAFGIPPGAAVGMSLQELLGPHYAYHRPCIEKALQGDAQELEQEISDRGHRRYGKAHYVPHRVDGQVQGLCSFIAEMTRHEGARDELSALQRRWPGQERLAGLATLAAGIAHEASNPLATVFGNVELALDAVEEGLIDRASLRSMLRDAHEAAGRLRDIVQGMKFLARADGSVRERVDVADAIDQSLAFAASTLRYRARVVREIQPHLYAHTNAAGLSQMLVHLLAHAVHTLPEEAPRDNEIRICARRNSARIIIEVAYNGPALLEVPVFARGLVESLGGQISASSALAQGSLLRIELGAAEPPRVASEPAPASLRRTLSGVLPARARPRLLVVDDEEPVATTLERVLARDGYDVVTVTNGRDAIRALCKPGEPPFELILCDLMMPEVSGENVYEEVTRVHPELSSRFIFMTGGAFTARGREFLATVKVPILVKPFDMTDLRTLVRARLLPAIDDEPAPAPAREPGQR